MNNIIKNITVCICTYKRNEYLSNLIKKLQDQETNGCFNYSILIVDNDKKESAKYIVESWRNKSVIEIEYQIEPIKNIALARNKAVNFSKGEYIAFIDDDEFPEKDWLKQLFESCSIYKADGVLGPVIPYYVSDIPKWISLGEPIDRKSFKTGTILIKPKYTRTGNVLLSRRVFNGETIPFNPKYGRTGGEDVDFFKRMIKNKYKFIWCDEAPIYEFVTKERLSRLYHLKRALLRGQVNYQQASFSERVVRINKSIIASFIYILSLPLMFILGQHLFMKYLIKCFDHIGMVISVFGINKIER